MENDEDRRGWVNVLADTCEVTVEVEFAAQAALLSYLDALNAAEVPPRWRLLRASAPSAQQAAGSAILQSRW